jgi:hypothetical protein
MKKIISLISTTLLIISQVFSQGNECTSAQNLGTLPTPSACPSGTGASVAVSGTNVGATPGSPYIYVAGCSASVPANDVWYSFVASGYELQVTVNSSFSSPQVTCYYGSCSALAGKGCARGTSGTVTLILDQMTIGSTYYLQVSGGTGQTGSFTMDVKNNIGCTDCLVASTISATPTPVSGTWAPGQTVNFCYHIAQYNQVNTNWLHGVQLSFGSGWNTSSIVATPPPACQGTGTWAYFPSGIGVVNGQTWGPGFYFDTSDPGTNPANNFGDNCVGPQPASAWNFCFSITTSSSCTPGSDLSVTVNTSGDGESGGWTSSGCVGDPASMISAVGACCAPTISQNNDTLTSSSSAAYQWYLNGVLISGATGQQYIISQPGTYTVETTHSTGCIATSIPFVIGPASVSISQTAGSNPACESSSVAFTATPVNGGSSPVYQWTVNNINAGTNSAVFSTATLTNNDTVRCILISDYAGVDTSNAIIMSIMSAPAVLANASSAMICTGDSVVLSGSGALTYAWDNGVSNNVYFMPTSTLTYNVTGTDVNGCSGSDAVTIVVSSFPAVPTISQTDSVLTSSSALNNQWFLDNVATGVTTQNFVATQNGLYHVVVVNAAGCSSQSAPFSFVMVWPGDANNDSLDNNFDLLPIGLFHSQTGTPRSTISTTWQGWASINWGISQSNGHDVKHADCNGDGVVDNSDVLAVIQNFSSVHTIALPNSAGVRTVDPDLFFSSSSSTYLPGDWIDIDIIAGNNSTPVSDLYGLAFNVNYDASLVEPGTEILFYPVTWLGDTTIDALKFSRVESTSNTAFGAVTRFDHTNRSGYGKIATLRFQARTTISSASTLNFSFSSYLANDSSGANKLFNDSSYSVLIDPLATGIEDHNIASQISVYPNPFSDHTSINYYLNEKSVVSLEIYNAIGQNIQTLVNTTQSAGSYSYNFSAKELGMDAGIYFMKITIDGKSTMKRIVEME